MDRRSFLTGIIAVSAPAIVRPASLMRINPALVPIRVEELSARGLATWHIERCFDPMNPVRYFDVKVLDTIVYLHGTPALAGLTLEMQNAQAFARAHSRSDGERIGDFSRQVEGDAGAWLTNLNSTENLDFARKPKQNDDHDGGAEKHERELAARHDRIANPNWTIHRRRSYLRLASRANVSSASRKRCAM